MRLYELAQELKTSNRDLLRQAEGLGLEVRTILSSLDDEDEASLRAGFKRPLEAARPRPPSRSSAPRPRTC